MPPSISHEAPLLVLRERPALVPELLRSALGVSLPAHDLVRVEDASFAQIVPTEYRADLVLTLVRDRPVMGLVVELQLARDRAKLRSWPLYAAALHARVDCPTALVVVTPSAAVASWARRPIASFQDGTFRPWVLGPEQIPVVDDVAQALRNPELGVLSALAHGRRPEGLRVGRAMLEVSRRLDRTRAGLYSDLVFVALGEAARRALEAEMDLSKYEFQSEFGRKTFGAWRDEGRALGRAEGRADAILAVLAERGIGFTDEDRERVEACRDLDLLRTWLGRAVVAGSIGEVLG